MKPKHVFILWMALLLVLGGVAQAQPERKGYVSDYANLLQSATIGELETMLRAYEQDTGNHLNVLIVPTLDNLSMEDYDARVTAAWELGPRHLLLLIALEEGAIRISTGEVARQRYPDRIIDPVLKETIIPAFSLGEYDRGVLDGVRQLMGLEPVQPPGPAAQLGSLFQGASRWIILGSLAALMVGVLFWLRP